MTETTKNTKTDLFLRRFRAFVAILLIAAAGYFVYHNATTDGARYPFKLGLDLAGGSHLVYDADVSKIDPTEVPALMNVLKSVIEKRINVFGVSEPIVQVEHSNFAASEAANRLVVELPGVTNIDAAIKEIGKTPLLEFKLIDEKVLQAQAAAKQVAASASSSGMTVEKVNGISIASTSPYVDTGLTGRYLQSASLQFASGQGKLSNEPIVAITFNKEGGDLFQKITTEHTGERLAIFLDGQLISSPRINEPISGGKAIISGGFTPTEARDLAQNLNFGALPVPIKLASTQTIGSTLGSEVLQKGIVAGAVGLALVIIFMLLWYRILGLVAAVALIGYVAIMLLLFQFIPVVLTAAGLAGFVLSLGMAVDANVLVFERFKEEWLAGKDFHEASATGFSRAWSAIRDGNVTSILSAIILFWFGTSIVKGFALVFGLGVIVSMLSALLVTRTLMAAFPEKKRADLGRLKWLYDIGIKLK